MQEIKPPHPPPMKITQKKIKNPKLTTPSSPTKEKERKPSWIQLGYLLDPFFLFLLSISMFEPTHQCGHYGL